MIEYKILTGTTHKRGLTELVNTLNFHKDGWRIESTHLENAIGEYAAQLIIILQRSVDYHD